MAVRLGPLVERVIENFNHVFSQVNRGSAPHEVLVTWEYRLQPIRFPVA